NKKTSNTFLFVLLVSSSFIIAALVNARHWKANTQTYASFQRLIAVVLRLWNKKTTSFLQLMAI
ncbi:MAG: hypothetical protein ABIN67_07130, partial [Ferruginibacter sp.]